MLRNERGQPAAVRVHLPGRRALAEGSRLRWAGGTLRAGGFLPPKGASNEPEDFLPTLLGFLAFLHEEEADAREAGDDGAAARATNLADAFGLEHLHWAPRYVDEALRIAGTPFYRRALAELRVLAEAAERTAGLTAKGARACAGRAPSPHQMADACMGMAHSPRPAPRPSPLSLALQAPLDDNEPVSVVYATKEDYKPPPSPSSAARRCSTASTTTTSRRCCTAWAHARAATHEDRPCCAWAT